MKNAITKYCLKIAVLFFVLQVGVVGAASESVAKGTPIVGMSSDQAQTSASQVVKGANNFAFVMFDKLYRQNKENKNINISPHSIVTALTMTYEGAAAATAMEMGKVLGLVTTFNMLDKGKKRRTGGNGLTSIGIHEAYLDLNKHYKDLSGQVQLLSANSLWASKKVEFKPQFIADNKKYFDAEVASADYGSPATLTRINSWVKDKTKGKIAEILKSIDADTSLILVNAVYFKGLWEKPFDKANTTSQPFYAADGTAEKIAMMSQSDKFNYFENKDFQAVQLQYGKAKGKGGKVGMYIFLPQKNVPLKKFVNQLSIKNWEQWLSQFERQEGNVQLPRYKIEYESSLVDMLKSLGMKLAFSPDKADFSNIAAVQTYISKVIHKAFIEVNEEGTEAAAATAVEMSLTSMGPMPSNPPFEFIANRPFFYAIVDNETHAILFMGVVLQPRG